LGLKTKLKKNKNKKTGLALWETTREGWLAHNSPNKNTTTTTTTTTTTPRRNRRTTSSGGGGNGDDMTTTTTDTSIHTTTTSASGTGATSGAIPLDVDEIIDVVFAPRWRGIVEDSVEPPQRFPQNVPLPQMVDILQDLWEAEGLDI